jgi:hypothetical protein
MFRNILRNGHLFTSVFHINGATWVYITDMMSTGGIEEHTNWVCPEAIPTLYKYQVYTSHIPGKKT